MLTIWLVHCLLISCKVFVIDAVELNTNFERYALSTLMKRIYDMETKIKDMERLASEASERERTMLGQIEYLGKKLNQGDILTNEILIRQEAMQREINDLHKQIYNQQEKTKLPDVALPDASVDVNKDFTGPDEDTIATTKLSLNGTSVRDISEQTKPSLVHPKRANGEPVAFSVYLSHYTAHLGNHQVIKYDGVLTNDWNGYNPFTGIFTCPEEGLYLFSFFTATLNEHKTWVELIVDGIGVSHAVSEGVRGGHDDQGGNVAILRIRAGQSVWTAIHGGADAELDSLDSYRHVTFSGVRLSA